MPESPLHFIRQNTQLFAQVGSVVATYRTRGAARFGPYYRLIYRQDRRQRSLYLGRSEQLATQVRLFSTHALPLECPLWPHRKPDERLSRDSRAAWREEHVRIGGNGSVEAPSSQRRQRSTG